MERIDQALPADLRHWLVCVDYFERSMPVDLVIPIRSTVFEWAVENPYLPVNAKSAVASCHLEESAGCVIVELGHLVPSRNQSIPCPLAIQIHVVHQLPDSAAERQLGFRLRQCGAS